MNSVGKKKLIDRFNIYCSMLILLVICAFATILSPSFLSMADLFNVFRQITVAGIVGCGITSVTLTGGVGFPVSFILRLTSALAFSILESTDNAGVATPATLAVGIGCGTVSGFFVAVCEIPPFVSTLGMIILLRGCTLVCTKGSPIPVKMDGYRFFGEGIVAGMPVPTIIFIILFLVAHYVLTQTSYGRSIYAFGDNREAACLPGISARLMKQMAYMLNGLMCGVAGMAPTVRLGSAQSTSGTGIEMDAITAVILGGTSLSGGIDFVLPTVVSAMTTGIIDNILTPMNVNPHATNIARGAVILIAVLVDKEIKDPSAKAE